MTLTLREMAGANFRSSEDADAINTTFMEHLGSRTRYLPARLAIGRSLRVPSAPPVVEQTGRAIKGETLFGADLATWLAMLVEHDGRDDVSLRMLQGIVAAHWSRGLGMLQRDWEAAGQDRDRLLRKLAEDAGLSPTASSNSAGDDIMPSFESGSIQVPVGEVGQDDQGQIVTWKPNAPAGSPHLAIMGGSGKGKTRTIAAMLRALRAHAPVPILAFDFKDDLTNQYNRLHEVFEAQVIGPPRQPIPLDVLHLSSSDPFDVKLAADRFCDSFSRLKGVRVGDRQKDALSSAAERALNRTRPTRLSDIRDALQAEYQRLGMKHDGAVSLLNSLCRYPLFEPLQTPEAFFKQSWIVRLPSNDATEVTRGIIVNLLLDALERFLLSLPNAPLDSAGNTALRHVLFLDEAHLVLGRKLPALSSLIRQVRSKGGIVILGSQSPDDFDGEDDDFLAQMGLVATFATNAKPAAVKRIMGGGLDLPGLPDGTCWVRRLGDQTPAQVKAFIP
jgi:DNA sulfur modification protein DndE